MKPFVTLYCEGTETKVALFSLEKESIKLLKTLSVRSADMVDTGAPTADSTDFSLEEVGEGISFEGDVDEGGSGTGIDVSELSLISSALQDVKLSQTLFLPIVTEPVVNFHIYEGETIEDRNKQFAAIATDISLQKGITVRKDYMDFIDYNSNSKLVVFIEEGIPCADLVYDLADYNKKRYLKIPSIKNAELSLAYYVSKTTKFFPEDFSLIIYTGKEYSKLIFLEGQNIKHIGSTLDIGTQNLQTYDVYFSKILLEMENGGIPRLDNVILCGEDNSENLILSFYGTFPEANVSELKFDAVDISDLSEADQENISAFSIPIAAAVEYYSEQKKEYKGINILPNYIKENQKFFQFGWHSYAMLPILFGLTFFFTYHILDNYRQIRELDAEILRLTNLQSQNSILMDQINPLNTKIASFGETQALLDSASAGTEIYWQMLEKISDFLERRRNFWVTKLETVTPDEVRLSGFSLSRSVLTEFADYNNSSLLHSIKYDPLREKNAFQYTLNFKLYNDTLNVNGP